MSHFNFQSQEVYDVKDGQFHFSNDMSYDISIYNAPSKKQTYLNSTALDSKQSEKDIDTPQIMENENQPHRMIESQIFHDNTISQNQNSASVLDCFPEQYPAELPIQNHESSNLYEPCQIENILSNQNLLNPLTPETKVQDMKQKVDKNDSKNVPKGMMKAFAHMILEKNPEKFKMLKRHFDQEGVNFDKYKQNMKKIRKSAKISIQNIRDMLLTDEFAVTTRKLSNFFIRKRFLSHIFNSKMEKRNIHLKYIPRWLQIFKDPEDFRSLK